MFQSEQLILMDRFRMRVVVVVEVKHPTISLLMHASLQRNVSEIVTTEVSRTTQLLWWSK